jgi:hypothetical protein
MTNIRPAYKRPFRSRLAWRLSSTTSTEYVPTEINKHSSDQIQTSVIVDSVSYLRLLKSIWIMDQIRDSEDWRRVQRTSPGGLYDRCVREMDRVSVKHGVLGLRYNPNEKLATAY